MLELGVESAVHLFQRCVDDAHLLQLGLGHDVVDALLHELAEHESDRHATLVDVAQLVPAGLHLDVVDALGQLDLLQLGDAFVEALDFRLELATLVVGGTGQLVELLRQFAAVLDQLIESLAGLAALGGLVETLSDPQLHLAVDIPVVVVSNWSRDRSHVSLLVHVVPADAVRVIDLFVLQYMLQSLPFCHTTLDLPPQHSGLFGMLDGLFLHFRMQNSVLIHQGFVLPLILEGDLLEL